MTPLGMRTVDDYEHAASDLVLAFDSRDEAALQRLNEQYGRTFSFDGSPVAYSRPRSSVSR